MSTDVIQNTNRLIEDTSSIRRFIESADIVEVRCQTKVDWSARKLLECHKELLSLLESLGMVDGDLTISTKGRVFLGKILLDLDRLLQIGMTIQDRYIIREKLASGKNSIAFKADDFRLGRVVVLKFFRIGRGEGVITNLPSIGGIKAGPILVGPLDVFKFPLESTEKNGAAVDVIVFPFIEGVTLREYLAREKNASPIVLQAFIEQTCLGLRALEKESLYHGDLHPNNILVTTEADGKAGFRLIDVSYGSDMPSDYELPSSDFEGFKLVLRLAVEDIQKRLVRISLRKHLGARIFTLVKYILGANLLTFEEIQREIVAGTKYTEFNENKQEFIRSKFRPPHDFGILRFEEFSNPNIAMALFHPYPELFQRLCEFGSTALFGHRGTGKSTYMAAMNFFPEVKQPRVDFRDSFGILFSCRQGEFRKFSGRNLKFNAETKLLVKDILITKIIRRTLGALAAGINKERLASPKSIRLIADLLLRRAQTTVDLFSSHQTSEVESLKATMVQSEVNAIDSLFSNKPTPARSKLLDEHSLLEFFEAVRSTFSELNQTRFSILFDDAGAPNIPTEVQSIVCDLMASTNSVYCVKLSAEKRTFELLTTDKKPVERVHDARVYTISDYFNLGGGFATERRVVENYYRELVSLRLKVCGYKSGDIRNYLGEEAMKTSEIVARLVDYKKGVPVYGGWQTVWQIADRTMRHLIEMISAIFDESKNLPGTEPRQISNHIQSRQILRFSNEKIRGLMLLPGTIVIANKKHSLGKKLYEFAASFGKVSAHYLRSSAIGTDGRARFDERLAIEIDNTLNLSEDAQHILDELVRFAVLDDEKMSTAFDDGARKPIYIFNRVYCPALRISFRRDAHWRLSSRRFESFLSSPTEFVGTDSQLAKFLMKSAKGDKELFD